MVAIPSMFEFPEVSKWFHLYISLGELNPSSDLCFVVYMVIQFEISWVFKSHLLGFCVLEMAGNNRHHSTNIDN